MKMITVQTTKTYNILVGSNILDNTGEFISDIVSPCKAVIITDDIVDSLYSKRVENSLLSNGFDVCKFAFKNSEKSKNISTFTSILEFMAKNEITRSDIVIALGGGVVGDIAGFCASSYLRGVKYIQIPTTFLACIDSSVGGKTAVNLNAGKNLVGSFYQPSLVICDYETLNTLEEDIFNDGVAEAIKYGFIKSSSLYSLLSTKDCKDNIEQIISQCVTIKRDIVNEDEFDTGNRQILNFGHTLGHCIEKLSNYKITHGKAVGIGMYIITKACFKKGMIKEDISKNLKILLIKYNLPYKCEYTEDDLYNVAVNDKKRLGNTLKLILPKEIGDCYLFDIDIDNLKDFIKLGL